MRRAFLASSLTLGLATASAVEVTDLEGLEDIYGTYAPAGDCKREPCIVVDVTGLGFATTERARSGAGDGSPYARCR